MPNVNGQNKIVGWEAGIRTPIPWSRATCPTVGRPPSTGQAYLSGKNFRLYAVESGAGKHA
jgi:hypothetical protein